MLEHGEKEDGGKKEEREKRWYSLVSEKYHHQETNLILDSWPSKLWKNQGLLDKP